MVPVVGFMVSVAAEAHKQPCLLHVRTPLSITCPCPLSVPFPRFRYVSVTFPWCTSFLRPHVLVSEGSCKGILCQRAIVQESLVGTHYYRQPLSECKVKGILCQKAIVKESSVRGP